MSPPTRNRCRAASLLLALGVLLSACTVGPSRRPDLATSGEPPPAPTSVSSATPLGPGGKGQPAADLNWGPCYTEAPSTDSQQRKFTVECAELRVPQSYDQPKDSRLTLSVARARLSATPTDAAPLLLLGDDPGRSGPSQLMELASAWPESVLTSHQLVTMRLRGVESLSCFERRTRRELGAPVPNPRQTRQADQMILLSQAIAYDCQDNFGAQITEFNSTAAADDVDTLRASLKQEKLRLVGTGTGGTIAAVYAGRYPGRVERLVLDAPLDPAASLTDRAQQQAIALETALDDFAVSCQALEGGCPAGARPRQLVEDLAAKLGTSGDIAGSTVFNAGSLLLVLSRYLHQPDTYADLAGALAAGRQGRFDQLGTLAAAISTGPANQRLWESRLAFQCNDTAQRLSAATMKSAATELYAKAPLFGPFLIGQAGLCASWPTSLSALGRQNAIGAPPILVIGATADPAAPFAGVKSVVSQLASASLVTWESIQHGSLGVSDCATGAAASYLTGGTMPPAGILCPP